MTSLPHLKVLFCQFSRCDIFPSILSFLLTATSQPKDSCGGSRKKQKAPKKRKKKDPNEPQKPVSAYALFFVTHRLPSRDRIPMPLLERFPKLLFLCGTVLEKSKNRWANNENNVIEVLKNKGDRDFHAGPVAKTPRFRCSGPRFNPWSELGPTCQAQAPVQQNNF